MVKKIIPKNLYSGLYFYKYYSNFGVRHSISTLLSTCITAFGGLYSSRGGSETLPFFFSNKFLSGGKNANYTTLF